MATFSDEILGQVAEIIVGILKDMDSEGCKWLYLAEAS